MVAHKAAHRCPAHIRLGIIGVEIYSRCQHLVGDAEVVFLYGHTRKTYIGLGAPRINPLQFLEIKLGLGVLAEHELGICLLVYDAI